MYNKPMVNAKRILIECEMTETVRLRVIGRSVTRLYCPQCESIDEMLDLNTAADVSGLAARELIRIVEAGVLHSPESAAGHLLICRASLELAINRNESTRPAALAVKESL